MRCYKYSLLETHSMKTFAIFTVAIVVTLVTLSHQEEEFSDAISVYRAGVESAKPTCLKVTNVKPEILDRALDHGEFPEDPELKCFLKCFLEHIQVMNDKGEINEANFKKNTGVTDETLANSLFQKCGVLKGADLCDTGFNISKCVYHSAKAALKSS